MEQLADHQNHILSQFKKYLSYQVAENNTAQKTNPHAHLNILSDTHTLIESLNTGHCYGLSLIRSLFEQINLGSWYQAVIQVISNWDGNKETLKNKVAISIKVETIGDIFNRVLNYMVSHQKPEIFDKNAKWQRDIFKQKGLFQLSGRNNETYEITAWKRMDFKFFNKQSFEQVLPQLISAISDNLCIIGNGKHACSIRIRKNKFEFYDVNYSCSTPKLWPLANHKRIAKEIFHHFDLISGNIQLDIASLEPGKKINLEGLGFLHKADKLITFLRFGTHQVDEVIGLLSAIDELEKPSVLNRLNENIYSLLSSSSYKMSKLIISRFFQFINRTEFNNNSNIIMRLRANIIDNLFQQARFNSEQFLRTIELSEHLSLPGSADFSFKIKNIIDECLSFYIKTYNLKHFKTVLAKYNEMSSFWKSHIIMWLKNNWTTQLLLVPYYHHKMIDDLLELPELLPDIKKNFIYTTLIINPEFNNMLIKQFTDALIYDKSNLECLVSRCIKINNYLPYIFMQTQLRLEEKINANKYFSHEKIISILAVFNTHDKYFMRTNFQLSISNHVEATFYRLLRHDLVAAKNFYVNLNKLNAWVILSRINTSQLDNISDIIAFYASHNLSKVSAIVSFLQCNLPVDLDACLLQSIKKIKAQKSSAPYIKNYDKCIAMLNQKIIAMTSTQLLYCYQWGELAENKSAKTCSPKSPCHSGNTDKIEIVIDPMHQIRVS